MTRANEDVEILKSKPVITGSALYPPFVLGGKRYDEKTFSGRFQNILIQYDARKLLESDATLDEAAATVEKFRARQASGAALGTHRLSAYETAELWRAQELLGARCHPDTGEQLPRLFTFAAFLPMQPPIILGLIWPGASAAHQAFFQIVNQFFNAGVNFANKNMSVPVSNEQLAASTAASVATAVGLSVGMVKLGERLNHPAVRGSAGFVGCLGAGWASLVLMRRNELEHGVDVFDEDGNNRGRSKVAAAEGIAMCCASRVVWNVPCTGVVPIVYSYYAASKFAAARPKLALPVHAGLITLGMCGGLLPGQALFTQTASIDASRLEPQLQNLTRNSSSGGGAVRTFTYNKGM